jgi:hypothetical protein
MVSALLMVATGLPVDYAVRNDGCAGLCERYHGMTALRNGIRDLEQLLVVEYSSQSRVRARDQDSVKRCVTIR